MAGGAGVAGGPGGVVVCPETREANNKNAAARRINEDSPRERLNLRIQDDGEESSKDGGSTLRRSQSRISVDKDGAAVGKFGSDHFAAEYIR